MKINFKFLFLFFASISLFCFAGNALLPSDTKNNTAASSEIQAAKAQTKIDSIINDALKKHVFPGCQVVVWKEGKVFLNKSYGYFTYENKQPVNDSTMYDLASLSKTTGTLLAIMKLYDEGKIKLTDKASDYLPFLKRTDKENITITDLLFHETGLQGSMFFYKSMYEKNNGLLLEMNAAKLSNPAYKYKEGLTSKFRTPDFNIQVSDSLFLHKSFHETAMRKIALSRLGAKTYLYSCVNFILLKEIAETVSGQSMDEFLNENFYQPMGLRHMAYLPLRSHYKSEITPTIKKDFLRNVMLQGYVHDPDAGFLGGVSGNAGLFADAHDVAMVYQMLLDSGTVNGAQYLSAETCKLFTTKTSASGRRGLGFDKPVPSQPNINPCSSMAPAEVYGHTGYTGTCCWVDPVNKLVYVFLSNRTYPDDGVNMLARLSIRPKIQEVIYQSIVKK